MSRSVNSLVRLPLAMALLGLSISCSSPQMQLGLQVAPGEEQIWSVVGVAPQVDVTNKGPGRIEVRIASIQDGAVTQVFVRRLESGEHVARAQPGEQRVMIVNDGEVATRVQVNFDHVRSASRVDE